MLPSDAAGPADELTIGMAAPSKRRLVVIATRSDLDRFRTSFRSDDVRWLPDKPIRLSSPFERFAPRLRPVALRKPGSAQRLLSPNLNAKNPTAKPAEDGSEDHESPHPLLPREGHNPSLPKNRTFQVNATGIDKLAVRAKRPPLT
jgi:hypothetical protein